MLIIHALCKLQTVFRPPLSFTHYACMLRTAGSEHVQKCESSSTGENVNEACEEKEHRKNSHKAKPGPHQHGGTDYIRRNIEVRVHTQRVNRQISYRVVLYTFLTWIPL